MAATCARMPTIFMCLFIFINAIVLDINAIVLDSNAIVVIINTIMLDINATQKSSKTTNLHKPEKNRWERPSPFN